MQFWQQVETALKTADPQEKCRLVNALYDHLLPQVNLSSLEDFPIVTPKDNIAAFLLLQKKVMRRRCTPLRILNLMRSI